MGSKRGIRAVIAVALVLLVAFVGYQFVNQWLSLRALNAEKAVLQSRIDTVTQKNEGLKEDIKQSSSDSFIERMARELLGWVKPGEIKIVDKGGK